MTVEKRLKRRANLLYRARKKGVYAITKERVFHASIAGAERLSGIKQVRALIKEYGFVIQLEF
jgi:hypothetical protein